MNRTSSARRMHPALGRFLVGLLATAFLLTGLAPASALAAAPADRIADGVTVDGVAVGGMSRAEATTALEAGLAGYATGQAEVTVGSRTATVTFAALGRHADVAGLVEAAWSIEREPPVSLAPELAALVHGTTVDPRVVADPATVAAAVAAAATATDIAPVNGAAKVTKTSFVRTAARNGNAMPQAAVIAWLTPLLTDPATVSPVSHAFAGASVAPAVTDAAVTAAISAARKMVRSVDVRRGSISVRIAASRIHTWIRFKMVGSVYTPMIGGTGITALTTTLKSMAKKFAVAPRNAKIVSQSRGSRITSASVRTSVDGRALSIATTRARIMTAVQARAEAPSSSASTKVTAAILTIKPAVDTAAAKKLVSKLRRLGPGWTTRYEVSERNGFGANITLPARTLNGVLLGPGESFDFWDDLGEVSTRTGYKPGGAIIGGRTEPTGALAGGICSASTTLFNAAARAGLDILERHNHYYYITRYPKGLDATVSKVGSRVSQNMRFRNDTTRPLLVRGFAGPGWVTFEVWGFADGRKVWFTNPTVTNYQRATDTVQYTSTLPKGVAKRIEYPVDGFNSVVVRTVVSSSGKRLHRDTFVSGYHRITGIVLVGR